MRDTSLTIRKTGAVVNFTPMGTSTLEILVRIKNMGKAHFTGSASALLLAQRTLSTAFSNIMGCGGVDCQMVKVNIKNQTVNFILCR